MNNTIGKKWVGILLLIYLLYSTTSVFAKLSALQPPSSVLFVLFLGCEFAVLGLYAIIWQQILKRVELTTAYMFRGVTIVYVLVFSAAFFNESITLRNVLGSAIIIAGITLYSKP